MLEKVLSLLRYHGEIPKSILLRAATMASITGCYIAFNKDGSCYMYPVKPILLKNSGKWIPRGRMGVFQSEEVKFTRRRYCYANWDLLIEPKPEAVIPFTYEKYKVTRELKRNSQV